jgi:hypothetical protein
MNRVFVSYSRDDHDAVTELIEDVKAAGLETWHDQTLAGGQRWWENILSNIRESNIFVFALSPQSCDSQACRLELNYAGQLHKTILPVLVADGINVNLLPPPLHEIQVADYRRRDKEAAFALVKSINTAPPNPPMPDPLPPSPSVPESYINRLQERIDASETLNSQAQMALVFELEAQLRNGRSSTEIRDLLLRLKRRDDLLDKVGREIDSTLGSLNGKAHSDPTRYPVADANSENSAMSNGAAPEPCATASTGLHPVTESGQIRTLDAPKLCPQCDTPVSARSGFCSSCGTPLLQQRSPRVRVPEAPKNERARTQKYACARRDTPRLIADVKNWLEAQEFDCQQMSTETDSVVLQIKKRGRWRDFVGMSTALNVLFHQSDDILAVEIGAGKWIDKAAVGTVSMFILWPLVITAAKGAWDQWKMPDKIFEHISTRLVYFADESRGRLGPG